MLMGQKFRRLSDGKIFKCKPNLTDRSHIYEMEVINIEAVRKQNVREIYRIIEDADVENPEIDEVSFTSLKADYTSVLSKNDYVVIEQRSPEVIAQHKIEQSIPLEIGKIYQLELGLSSGVGCEVVEDEATIKARQAEMSLFLEQNIYRGDSQEAKANRAKFNQLLAGVFHFTKSGMKIKVLEFFDSKNESINCPGQGDPMNGMVCLDIEKNIKFRISSYKPLTQFWPAKSESPLYIGMFERFIPIE